MKTQLIFLKELKDAFRDKRTIIMTIVIPTLLIPLMLFGQFFIQKTEIERAQEQVVKLIYSGPADIKELLVVDKKIVFLPFSDEIGKKIEEKDADAALVIQDGKAVIHYDPTKPTSAYASQKLKNYLLIYSEKVIEARLQNIGLDPNIIKVFDIKEESVASPSKMGAFFAAMLIPIMILSIGISGNMYLFSDIGAGEKERGTLEPLLATPAKRQEIATGKWLAVSSLSFFSIVLMLVVMLLTINYGQPLFLMPGQEGASLKLEPIALIILTLGGLLLALSGGALQFTISIWARNIREAQLYLGYLPMVVILPVVFLNIMGIMGNIPNWSYYIPLINLYPIIYTAIMNEMVFSKILIALSTNTLLTILGIMLVTRILNREEVILRT